MIQLTAVPTLYTPPTTITIAQNTPLIDVLPDCNPPRIVGSAAIACRRASSLALIVGHNAYRKLNREDYRRTFSLDLRGSSGRNFCHQGNQQNSLGLYYRG